MNKKKNWDAFIPLLRHQCNDYIRDDVLTSLVTLTL